MTTLAWAADPSITLPCQQPDVDPDWWFDQRAGSKGIANRMTALYLCSGCPRRVDCLVAAKSFPRTQTVGIWGGVMFGQMNRADMRSRKNGGPK